MNQIILFGLTLAAVFAVSLSAMCTPDQWEGYQGALTGYVHDRHPGVMKEFAAVSYDAKNERKAMFVTIVKHDHEEKFHIVVRYDKAGDGGNYYIKNLKSGKCFHKALEKPFRKACLPEEAKHMYDYSMGLKGAGGLAVSAYGLRIKETELMVVVSKAGKDIIPISESFYGHVRVCHTDFVQGMGFSDITPGIKNETVFAIPEGCKKEEFDLSIPDYLMRDNKVLVL